jgi:hypothetical protein
MLIIGCDFHTRYQQIAMAEDSTEELLTERHLDHESGEAEAFSGARARFSSTALPSATDWIAPSALH